MDAILIANENNLLVIEDNAHGLLVYKNKFLGTLGTFSTQSTRQKYNLRRRGALFINDANI